jgi:hypothetical protein
MHAEIEFHQGQLVVRDLGSSNGTWRGRETLPLEVQRQGMAAPASPQAAAAGRGSLVALWIVVAVLGVGVRFLAYRHFSDDVAPEDLVTDASEIVQGGEELDEVRGETQGVQEGTMTTTTFSSRRAWKSCIARSVRPRWSFGSPGAWAREQSSIRAGGGAPGRARSSSGAVESLRRLEASGRLREAGTAGVPGPRARVTTALHSVKSLAYANSPKTPPV